MHPSPSSALWRVLLFMGFLGVGYPVEVLDVDETATEETCSENLGTLEAPALPIVPCPERGRSVVAVRPDPRSAPAMERGRRSSAARAGRHSQPNLARASLPRGTLNAPPLSADPAPRSSAPRE